MSYPTPMDIAESEDLRDAATDYDALAARLSEAERALETAVGANALWKRLHDEAQARLAEAEATASTANHGHELCYEKLLSAEARLAEMREARDAAGNIAERYHARLTEAERLLSLSRDYVDSNQGGWCRDGVGSGLVIKHIDAFLRPADEVKP